MDGIHECFSRWDRVMQDELVIATLLSVQGHSYRKPGAVMLLGRDGPVAGSLSPGCLEADLGEHAIQVMDSGIAKTVTYDMSDSEDPEWGETAFCGGRLVVLLEPLQGDLRDAFLLLRRWMSQGHTVRFNRIMDHRGNVQAYRLIQDWGYSRRFGQVSRSFWVWSAFYSPKPRLVLFGAGKDARPVMELAARSGFEVVAADWRETSGLEAVEGQASLPYGSCVFVPMELLFETVRLKAGDRVLLMSHQYRQDRYILEQLLRQPVRYIGILGSKTRASRLTEGLLQEPDPRIHSPVGLPIGASGPEQIAVSIVAELIQDASRERREKRGGELHAGALRRGDEGHRQEVRSGSR